jgi:hypothetical protein
MAKKTYGDGKPYQGRYPIKNYQKYKGNPTNIIFRSSWELRFMQYADNNPNIVEWGSEEIVIPYLSPKDNEMHRYFPDFWIKVKTDYGFKECLIEVKPKHQCNSPKVPKRKTRRYLNECVTFEVNKAKWAAAEAYCNKHNMKFVILTEDDLL